MMVSAFDICSIQIAFAKTMIYALHNAQLLAAMPLYTRPRIVVVVVLLLLLGLGMGLGLG